MYCRSLKMFRRESELVLNKILELSKYRLSKAREELDTSIELIGIGRFSQSVNRSYYSIFHAVRALFAIEEVDFKKHSGVISHFQHNYIKTGKFEKGLSNIIVTANVIRNQSDYNDFVVVTKEEASKQVENAERFLKEMENYLNVIFNEM